jgi:hypothetical protein
MNQLGYFKVEDLARIIVKTRMQAVAEPIYFLPCWNIITQLPLHAKKSQDDEMVLLKSLYVMINMYQHVNHLILNNHTYQIDLNGDRVLCSDYLKQSCGMAINRLMDQLSKQDHEWLLQSRLFHQIKPTLLNDTHEQPITIVLTTTTDLSTVNFVI